MAEFELGPDVWGQRLRCASKSAHDTGVGDEGHGSELALMKFGDERQRARLQLKNRFAPVRGRMQDIGRPGIELLPWNACPRLAFPTAEIKLLQSIVENRRGMQACCQPTAAAQGAGDYRYIGGELLHKLFSNIAGVLAIDIQTAIAETRLDQRRRVSNQDNLHNRPR